MSHTQSTPVTDHETPDPHPAPLPVAEGTPVVKPHDLPVLTAILPVLAEKRVVFVGESHNQYAHHLNELAIIRDLHRRNPNLAIGLEFFQQPFQLYLDDYVAGRIDEATMLRSTEYFQRWRFDYRLYRPILRFAREKHIPLVALNVPAELTQRVARQGLATLSAEERHRWVAGGVDRTQKAYRDRIKQVFSQHPRQGDFEHFLDAQLLWDEGMAQRAADYLHEHPARQMVILAGSGHIMDGDGIPDRLKRRMPEVTIATVVNDLPEGELDRHMADYVLFPVSVDLPPVGMLGVYMKRTDKGVLVDRLVDNGAAAKAGLSASDYITEVDGNGIYTVADVKIALLDKVAGDTVPVTVKRNHWWRGEQEKTFTLTLQ